MNDTPTHTDFLRVLEPWPAFAEQYWWDDPERPDLGCFGTGYNSWGVQTNQKFLGAYAVLAADPDLDEQVAGRSREEILDKALRALRFSLASHVSGDHHCSDGTQWGHTWISALGVERMMHGVDAIAEQMTEQDREGLRRMLVSEADALLDLEVTATKWAADRGNRPESNIWNGAILARTCMMYPDEPRLDPWMEKAHRFLVNGISIEADAEDETLIAGRPIKDWHVGPNFFPNYALDHHGYLNVGYMVICLSNIAMLHFACKRAGQEAPADLYHHAANLWALVKRLIFEDGRLIRIGGDTRQRYCYCQDYLLPSLALAADYLRDAHAPALEAGALDLIRQEQAANADGGFLSQRLETIRSTNPYYYTRLMFHRSARRMASWSWRASEAPQGLCLPPASGHLAEWCSNLGGLVGLLGETGKRTVLRHEQATFEGGFLTVGTVADSAGAAMAEGWKGTERAEHHYAVAALPDQRTQIVLEYCRLGLRIYLAEVKGLKLNVPNDLFSGYRRRYFGEHGEVVTNGAEDQVRDLESRWVNVEGVIGAVGIYGADSFAIRQAGKRQASGYADSLYYDELCFPFESGVFDVNPGTVVLDCGSVVLSGADREETRELAEGGVARLECDRELERAVQVAGADAEQYVLSADFSDDQPSASLRVGEAVLARVG